MAEISEGYQEAAVRLSVGIAEAKERLKNGDESAGMELRQLKQALSEVRTLRRLTRDYYTRSRDPVFSMTWISTRGNLND